MFLIENPEDEFGNTAYPPAVIEVAANDRNKEVIAPEEIRRRWPTLGPAWSFRETQGPARMLTREEWVAIHRSGG